MDEIRTVVFGVLGGVLGAFFKFWIQDLRDWNAARLSRREQALLKLMLKEKFNAEFKISEGNPPIFKNSFSDIDHPEFDFEFIDQGETKRLVKLGIIEEVTRTNFAIIYRLTGEGYFRAERLK